MSAIASAPALPRGCSFEAEDWGLMARHWYPVALARAVADGPVAARLLDAPLVVYRLDGAVVVADDLCPHRGVPLSMGSGDAEGIT